MSRGSDQMIRSIKKGKMEKGATSAPERDKKSGKDVKGRHINAIAHIISQIRSRLFPNLLVVSVTKPSCKAFSMIYKQSTLELMLLKGFLGCAA
jgi:hypothetical protein